MKQLMTENLPFEDAPFRRSQICLPRTETADTGDVASDSPDRPWTQVGPEPRV